MTSLESDPPISTYNIVERGTELSEAITELYKLLDTEVDKRRTAISTYVHTKYLHRVTAIEDCIKILEQM